MTCDERNPLRNESDLRMLAEMQFGVFSAAQASEAGVSPSGMSRRVANRVWERVLPKVYRLVGAPSPARQPAMAAALWAGDGAVISHGTAGRLWSIPGARQRRVELWVPEPRAPRAASVTVHRGPRIEGADRTDVGPLPITTPVRTLIDLSGRMEDVRLMAVDGGPPRSRSRSSRPAPTASRGVVQVRTVRRASAPATPRRTRRGAIRVGVGSRGVAAVDQVLVAAAGTAALGVHPRWALPARLRLARAARRARGRRLAAPRQPNGVREGSRATLGGHGRRLARPRGHLGGRHARSASPAALGGRCARARRRVTLCAVAVGECNWLRNESGDRRKAVSPWGPCGRSGRRCGRRSRRGCGR